MTGITYDNAPELTEQDKQRALGALFASGAIWLGVFFSGFVMAEPAPYELFLVVLIAIWAMLGLRIPAGTAPLIVLLMIFNIGGLVTLSVTDDVKIASLYIAVSFFLAFTSIFFAAIVALEPSRLKLMFSAYVAAGLFTGMLGILGYFGAIPGGEKFTLFDRAKGAFEDPNVFAPFLCLPALYCLYQVLTQKLRQSLLPALWLLILTFAVFLSFSRAGWGIFVFHALMLVGILLISNPSNAFRMRIAMLAVVAFTGLILALLVALQFEAVRDLFMVRAQLVQDYDSARLGRFARHGLGFLLATENPLGIGILEFARYFGEDTHNIWLKALLEYSWLGFAAYFVLVIWTLSAGFKIMFRDRPWKPYLLCAYIVFVGHVIVGTVIDTDHWRHFFLILGIIWGCIAAEDRYQRGLLKL